MAVVCETVRCTRVRGIRRHTKVERKRPDGDSPVHPIRRGLQPVHNLFVKDCEQGKDNRSYDDGNVVP